MTPEGKVKERIKALLKSIGAWYYMPVPTGFAGASVDFFVCWRGQFYAIEAKRADGRGTVSARQKDTLRAVAEAGGGTCVEDTLECTNVRRMMGLP